MALKKKSLHRLSSFHVSNSDQSPPPPGPVGPPAPGPVGSPPPYSANNDGRLRPVSQQLPSGPADDAGWNPVHQRAVSQQLRPPPANYGPNTLSQLPRKAISSDRLRPGVSESRTTGLRPSPSTPNLLAPNSPYRHQSGSTPNLVPPAQHSRPGTASSSELTPVFPAASDGPSELNGSKIKRKSGLFGGKKHKKEEVQKPAAWICTTGKDYHPYPHLSSLFNGRPVPELWNENGDTFVYLFPKQSGRGASFKVDSEIFSSSAKLTKWAFGHLYSIPAASRSNAAVAQEVSQRRQASMDAGRRQYSSAVPGTPPTPASARYSMTESSEDSRDSRALDPIDPSQPIHLYIPLNLSDSATQATSKNAIATHESDTDALVAIRNLFAFLTGQSFVATRNMSTFYHIFIKISQALNFYEFSNLDGSTFGEVANYNFDLNVRELRINDVRSSREKTIEGIVLGETMRSVLLYNEAFTHAVGRLKEIKDLRSPKYTMISNRTVDLLDRGSIDLDGRLETMTLKLTDFQFYGLFQGVLNSSTADESKQLNFDRWKSSYQSMRRWFITYQKGKWGHWPPRVGKKNHLQTDGLNRIVLKELYADVSLLYDLLVDRTALTTRTGDLAEELTDTGDIIPRALRKVLAEYDRSTPPVLPPVPFDVPILPKVTNQRDLGRKLKKHEANEVLNKSYNADTNITDGPPILTSFRTFDSDSAHGLTIENIGDQRCGQWLFLYAVLQTLPWLVVDAPALEHTAGVEYFVCVAPRSGVPWAREDVALNRNWYGVAGSDKIVSLPADVLIHGVEGTYRRSHCWARAEQWTAGDALLKAAAAETIGQALPPPPLAPGQPGRLNPLSASRSNSPEPVGRRSKRASVVDLGLEALPMPAGVQPEMQDGQPGRQRPVSGITGDPSITFDAILGSAGLQGPASSKKKR